MNIKAIASLIYTSVAGANGKETGTAGIIAALGTFCTALLGGWDIALRLLIYLMIADYVTGLLSAMRNKNMNSEIMFWGGIRKAIILLVVFLAVQLDQLVGGTNPVFRTMTLYFYVGREGLSVVENLGIIGVPLPPAISKFLEQLQQKGEDDKPHPSKKSD
jgi:toxin secretion/phage lysis holin